MTPIRYVPYVACVALAGNPAYDRRAHKRKADNVGLKDTHCYDALFSISIHSTANCFFLPIKHYTRRCSLWMYRVKIQSALIMIRVWQGPAAKFRFAQDRQNPEAGALTTKAADYFRCRSLLTLPNDNRVQGIQSLTVASCSTSYWILPSCTIYSKMSGVVRNKMLPAAWNEQTPIIARLAQSHTSALH